MNMAFHSDNGPTIYINEGNDTLTIENNNEMLSIRLGELDALIVKLMAGRSLLSPRRAIEESRF